MAATKPYIGIDKVEALANVLHKEILMSGSNFRPDVLTRLGIAVISGIQFQDTKNVMNRKGGTTRRKEVGDTINSQAGYLEERKLTTTPTWNRYFDNIDNYREIAAVDITGTNITHQYPLSSLAIMANATTYGEDIFNCLFHGDVSLPKTDPMGLYDGFITNVRKDITSGRISVKNKNYVVLDAIDTNILDNTDTSAWKTFKKFKESWHASLQNQPLVIVWATPEVQSAIVESYAHAYVGMQTPNMADDSYRFLGMPNVRLVGEAALGKGDMLIATVPDNAEYGVDDENDKSTVGVGVDPTDLKGIVFQIDSNQGTRILNVNPQRFCISSGTLTPVDYAGDYKYNSYDIGTNNEAWGTVAKTPDNTEYEYGATITITATPTVNGEFVKWSNGETANPMIVTAKAQPEMVSAIFKAKV